MDHLIASASCACKSLLASSVQMPGGVSALAKFRSYTARVLLLPPGGIRGQGGGRLEKVPLLSSRRGMSHVANGVCCRSRLAGHRLLQSASKYQEVSHVGQEPKQLRGPFASDPWSAILDEGSGRAWTAAVHAAEFAARAEKDADEALMRLARARGKRHPLVVPGAAVTKLRCAASVMPPTSCHGRLRICCQATAVPCFHSAT